MAALKRSTDLAISRHPELITFLSSQSRCGEAAISIWGNGLTPALITDFWKKHSVVILEDSVANFPNLLSPNVTTILLLSPIVEFTFQAIQFGGNAEQKSVIDQLRGYRERALETTLHDIGKRVDSDFSLALRDIMSGERKVDMSE